MLSTEILQDYEQLPVEAKKQVIDFIAFIKTRYRSEDNVEKAKPAAGHSFGAVKVTKRVTLEQMDAAIRQRGGTL